MTEGISNHPDVAGFCALKSEFKAAEYTELADFSEREARSLLPTFLFKVNPCGMQRQPPWPQSSVEAV